MAITVYTYNDKVLKNISTDKWLKKAVDPYNPLGLPANTIRIKLASGSSVPSISNATVTAVQGQTDVYDVYKDSTDWNYMFSSNTSLVEVLGANTSNVTNMDGMFYSCTSLTSVALFDTSNVTIMVFMFAGASSLSSVPLFNTSSVINMYGMLMECSSLASIPLFNTSSVEYMSFTFYGCTNVQSGALALYQQASTQTTPPEEYEHCFGNCGSNTVTGAAELAQIPSSWGGTAA